MDCPTLVSRHEAQPLPSRQHNPSRHQGMNRQANQPRYKLPVTANDPDANTRHENQSRTRCQQLAAAKNKRNLSCAHSREAYSKKNTISLRSNKNPKPRSNLNQKSRKRGNKKLRNHPHMSDITVTRLLPLLFQSATSKLATIQHNPLVE